MANGQTIGYTRVSSVDQNNARQLEGLILDRTFADKASGKDLNRPQLEAAISFVREGDTLVVHIDKIDFNRDWGWGGSIPYFGALAPEYKTMMNTAPVPDRLFIWRIDRNRRVGTLDLPNSKIGRVEVPQEAFVAALSTNDSAKPANKKS